MRVGACSARIVYRVTLLLSKPSVNTHHYLSELPNCFFQPSFCDFSFDVWVPTWAGVVKDTGEKKEKGKRKEEKGTRD